MELTLFPEPFLRLREEAKRERDPACADETLSLMLEKALLADARSVLEIGAAEGLTSIAFALKTRALITAIECDPARVSAMKRNVETFGVRERVKILEGDAGEILPRLAGEFDLIFLDGPKVQYRKYLPDCKRLLKGGGYLFSDDVLLFGWVRGEPPKKRRMLARHLGEYLEELEADPDFSTEILPYGEGLAVSVKR